MNTDEWRPMYINGVLRNVTGYRGRFYADAPELPRRRCSQHWLPNDSINHLRNGITLRTSGTTYSLFPTKEPS